jgi:hypothetical protein
MIKYVCCPSADQTVLLCNSEQTIMIKIGNESPFSSFRLSLPSLRSPWPRQNPRLMPTLVPRTQLPNLMLLIYFPLPAPYHEPSYSPAPYAPAPYTPAPPSYGYTLAPYQEPLRLLSTDTQPRTTPLRIPRTPLFMAHLMALPMIPITALPMMPTMLHPSAPMATLNPIVLKTPSTPPTRLRSH